MAEFYAMRIMDKKTTFAKVPLRLKDAVREILINKGCTELFDAEGGENA